MIARRHVYLGHDTPSPLGRVKVTGQGRFPPDYPTEGMLHVSVLRSHSPHAAIRHLDVSRAKRMPGVAAALTRKELGLDDTLRHHGDTVAAVAAETIQEAHDATSAIEFDIERRPSIHDPASALAGEAPRLDPNKKTNLALQVDLDLGDVRRALQDCDIVLEATYETGRPTHCNLSPRCCIARQGPDGTLEVMTSVDAPFFAQRELAEELDVPLDQVRVVLPELLTSSFGGRSSINRHCEPIAARLAMSVDGRPVRLIYDPVEEFIAGTTRHAVTAHLVAGATADGTLVALSVEVLADHGPYDTFVNRVVLGACRDRPLDLYELEHYHYRGRAVLTNNLMGGEMRGIGATQINYVLGSHMDELARRLEIDPVEFHLQNMAQKAAAVPSGGLSECLRRGAGIFGWKTTAVEPTPGHKRRGVGMAVGTHTTGLGTFHGNDRASAVVTLERDGSVTVSMGSPDSGQGNTTIFAQIVSEELSVSPSSIRFRPIDTGTAPPDPWGSVASRGTYVVGSAVKLAASGARRRLLEAAAPLLGAEPEHLNLGEGRIRRTTEDGPSLTLAEIAAQVGPLENFAEAVTEATPPTYGAYFAEVEIDVETGRVEVTRFVAAIDVGYALNPVQCIGQIEGAIAHGIEFALGADVVMRQGMPENTSLVDYPVAATTTMPQLIRVELVEGAEATGPYGARGIGTPAMTPVLPALANAVRDALGHRIPSVPMRPELVMSYASGRGHS